MAKRSCVTTSKAVDTLKTPAVSRRGFFFYLACRAGAAAALLVVGGCASTGGSVMAPTLNHRADASATLVSAEFVEERIPAGDFELYSAIRVGRSGAPLTIYIEGDGLAWKGRSRLSEDPTPIRQTTVQLAVQDEEQNVAYLARPGQFLDSDQLRGVDAVYWSDKRFSEEVLASMNSAVSTLAMISGAKSLHLVGYSGGAAIAVLIASRRTDIASIRTVAGNLDPTEVNRIHHVSPLTGSLDPMSAAAKVSGIPQIHYTGSKDSVVTGQIAQRFLEASGDGSCITLRSVDGATHSKGWTERWREFLEEEPVCQE